MGPLEGLSHPSSKSFRQVLARAGSEGHFKAPITPLLAQQIGALIGLGVTLKMGDKPPKGVMEETGTAILRLLGLERDAAKRLVGKVAAKLSH